jgi:CheY-like chemotaxis protein
VTATGKARRILVVDDEPDVCACLSRLLQEHGFAVSARRRDSRIACGSDLRERSGGRSAVFDT